MKPLNLFLVWILASSFLSVGWIGKLGLKTRYLNGIDQDGDKVYAGKIPIHNTYAYRQFKSGSKTEASKLYYFLSRLYEMKDCSFRFLGKRYDSRDAYSGINWLITRRYQSGRSAREFLSEQIAHFEKPGAPLLIEFPDGSLHRVLPVVMNELDLLEETARREARHTPPPFQNLPN